MATVIGATIPVEEFALAETLQRCPDATIDAERLVEQPADTVLPLVWVRHTSPDRFEAALEQDPTVASYTRLASTDTEWLYEMDWQANIQLVLRILTTEGAVILDTTGSVDGWHLRVLFPDRDDVRTTTEFCETYNITLNINTIRHLDDDDARQGGIRADLTAAQNEALLAAYERDYFAVPRGDDLEAVATDLGVSHQALSERLRRGHQALIEDTLVNETTPPTGSAGRSDEESARPDTD
jgi:predicted DNA binding protein